MTNQEIVDKVFYGMEKQGFEKSLTPNGTGCAYRGANGTACAVGQLIPDEVFATWPEECNTQRIGMIYHRLIALGISDRQIGLLAALQDIHDGMDPEVVSARTYWLSHLARIGYAPTPPVVQEHAASLLAKVAQEVEADQVMAALVSLMGGEQIPSVEVSQECDPTPLFAIAATE